MEKEVAMEKDFMILGKVTVVAVIIILATVLFSTTLVSDPQNPYKDNLQRFDSYESLIASFKSSYENSNSRYKGMDILGGIAPTMMNATGDGVAESSGGSDFSTTNIQVEGVDEADIVKTDGKYIYAISGNKLFIVDSYPIDGAEIVLEKDFNGQAPQEMFISGNKLILFLRDYGSYYGYYPGCYNCEVGIDDAVGIDNSIRPFGYNGVSKVQVFDITNKSSLVLEKEYEFEGDYLTARMIDNKVHFVVNSYPRYYIMEEEFDINNETNIIPLMREDGVEASVAQVADAKEIGFVPNVSIERFVTIATLNLSSLDLEKETVAASGQTVYASQNNIYLVENNYGNEPVVLQALKSIFVPNWENVNKTSILKFNLDSSKPIFVGSNTVPGSVLNQFSMDEHNNYFRIATTTNSYSQIDGSQKSNNVYVLNDQMEIVGLLEDLAPGEQIYSARFMGGKGYMVTFKKVDPLFVLDLSDPTNPTVLGKLKIPGYSDYLHPIDETHILGLGKDSIPAEYGDFSWYQGIKIAIFDVSDVSNPIELHKIVIGDRGTDSYALHDHRAFLFNKEKELLVIPITLAEIPADVKNADPNSEIVRNFPAYGEQVFQGAMVFNVSIANGFSERGRITHVTSEDELKRGYYYDYSSAIKRSLYIENILYTISDRMLKANNLITLEELKSFTLNPAKNNYYGPEAEVMVK